MRILHLSDTHGGMPSLAAFEGQYDLIVHSGDFGPTAGRRMGERINPRREHIYQRRWYHHKRARLKAWLGSSIPVLVVPGNHDFEDVARGLHEAGVNAHGLSELRSFVYHDGDKSWTFGGFRYVSYVDGEWCGEIHEDRIAENLTRLKKCDILVSHSPPYAVLDEDMGRHWGSSALLNEFLYRRPDEAPRAILCGHVHGSGGRREMMGRTLVVNSATTIQFVST